LKLFCSYLVKCFPRKKKKIYQNQWAFNQTVFLNYLLSEASISKFVPRFQNSELLYSRLLLMMTSVEGQTETVLHRSFLLERPPFIRGRFLFAKEKHLGLKSI
jgi:hypothetical protein